MQCRNRKRVNRCTCVNGNCQWSSKCGISNERSIISEEPEKLNSIRTINVEGNFNFFFRDGFFSELEHALSVFRRTFHQFERLHKPAFILVAQVMRLFIYLCCKNVKNYSVYEINEICFLSKQSILSNFLSWKWTCVAKTSIAELSWLCSDKFE